MKKLFLLIVVASFFIGCSKPAMETPILNDLDEKDINDFPAIIVKGDTLISGKDYYEDIRDGVSDILNKPSNELSFNEKKAMELFNKITYKDCYELTVNVMNYAVDLESLKELNQKVDLWGHDIDKIGDINIMYHAFEHDVYEKIKNESSDLYFLIVDTEILDWIVPVYLLVHDRM